MVSLISNKALSLSFMLGWLSLFSSDSFFDSLFSVAAYKSCLAGVKSNTDKINTSKTRIVSIAFTFVFLMFIFQSPFITIIPNLHDREYSLLYQEALMATDIE